MLDIDAGKEEMLCSGVTRRSFVRLGALSVLGLTLPDLLRLEAANAAGIGTEGSGPKAKNVLLIYLGGGLTHHDTFDPKPQAPQEIRGKYGVMQGGDYPSIGSIVTHETSPLNTLPPYVAVPKNHSFTWELGKAAFLGERYESFKSGNPADGNWKVPNLSLLADVNEDRLNRRQGMLKAIDNLAKRVETSDQLNSMDTFYQQASRMILSSEARQAFDLTKEPDSVRDKYGRDFWGSQALLSRRLIEGGVRFVLLCQGGWDHHSNIFPACDNALPRLDRSIATMLRDMKERGLLKDTLVAMYGEFGRTSKINKDNGRDHWGNAGVMLFAGAGVRPGQVIGETDDRGEYVIQRPIRPPDIAATIYSALGIDYTKRLYTPQDRPVSILPDCDPIKELWSGA